MFLVRFINNDLFSNKRRKQKLFNKVLRLLLWKKYIGLSLSGLPSISNISLPQTISLVFWKFPPNTPYFSFSILNLFISYFFLSRAKLAVLLQLFLPISNVLLEYFVIQTELVLKIQYNFPNSNIKWFRMWISVC